MNWKGVIPAVTTSFDARMAVDHAFMAEHVQWLAGSGCSGVVVLGSLGEGATLSRAEKLAIVGNCSKALGDRVPVVGAISALATAEAVSLARAVAEQGASALLILPPYVYRGDWRETRAHFSAVLRATDLPCMLYNNPVAYGTDVLPEQFLDLASDHSTLEAIKESSGEVRRITTLRALLGERVEIAVGVDDVIVEGVAAGATGWIAGLANALPAESVELLEDAMRGDRPGTLELYRWFLPLLRMDTAPKFVQLIKLVQTEVGHGNRRVRAPRLELSGEELAQALRTIQQTLARRPKLRRRPRAPGALRRAEEGSVP